MTTTPITPAIPAKKTLVTNHMSKMVSFHGTDPRYAFLATEERAVDEEVLRFLLNDPSFRFYLTQGKRGMEVEGMSREAISKLQNSPREKIVPPRWPVGGMKLPPAKSSVDDSLIELDNRGVPKPLAKDKHVDVIDADSRKKSVFKPKG